LSYRTKRWKGGEEKKQGKKNLSVLGMSIHRVCWEIIAGTIVKRTGEEKKNPTHKIFGGCESEGVCSEKVCRQKRESGKKLIQVAAAKLTESIRNGKQKLTSPMWFTLKYKNNRSEILRDRSGKKKRSQLLPFCFLSGMKRNRQKEGY